ncbi:MAG: 23S rRNA (adenine(2503)-C(2))-methyltransferase RlmN [candidate division Zixibacteria bacterium]|nr:23S rRNA (adenine(2503)-C(2))-methyltransferase RlmN [candidate division Zixibacteria bacterium]MDD5425685.1 23S rRNA (adenine(2503)-C(2))-methyltransferase RlmN [candidate division Zixibacteria bacterium]
MSKENLLGRTLPELQKLLVGLGEKPYRGRQLFKWLYGTRQYDFNLMTDFSRKLREELTLKYTFEGLRLQEKVKSADETEKFLFRLEDEQCIESVLIPNDEKGRNTVCISTQAGCAMDCKFCATGKNGLARNLTVGEILGQLIFIRELYGLTAFTNIVFMGMGEPLNNFDNLIRAIEIITDSAGLGLAAKKITVSTAGIVPRIYKLADLSLKVRLALSLNAAIQEKRVKIMPVAETYPLDKLAEAVRYYTQKTGFRVTFEYVLFDGFNDQPEDIIALTELIKGIPCKINIFAYNPVPGMNFTRPSDEKVDWFARELYPRAPAVTVRKSRGRDIAAACGQLAGKINQGGSFHVA